MIYCFDVGGTILKSIAAATPVVKERGRRTVRETKRENWNVSKMHAVTKCLRDNFQTNTLASAEL